MLYVEFLIDGERFELELHPGILLDIFTVSAGQQQDAKERGHRYCFSAALSGIDTVTTVPPPSLGVMVRLPPHMSSSL